ncbi:MAG: hypothetical protein WD066_15930 [Planctomycetaceae bacterium]
MKTPFARWITLALFVAAMIVFLVASFFVWDAEARLATRVTSYPVMTVVQPAPHDPEAIAQASRWETVRQVALVAGLLALGADLATLNLALARRSRTDE